MACKNHNLVSISSFDLKKLEDRLMQLEHENLDLKAKLKMFTERTNQVRVKVGPLTNKKDCNTCT